MSSLIKYLTPVVMLAYTLLGVAAVFGWKPVAHIPFGYRMGFAGICLIYIIYRGYRYYVTYFKKEHE